MLVNGSRAIVMIVVAVGFGHSASTQTPAEVSERLREGRVLYNENCAICHGSNGDGAGSLAPQFSPRPRDFTKGSFKFTSTGIGEPPAEVDLLRIITNGIEGSYGRSMPSFDHLTLDQKMALLAVIQDFAGIETLGTSIDVPPSPDAASAEKGRVLYVQNGCIECHGANGDGRGVLSDTLRDDANLPIKPANFRAGLFKGGDNPEDIWMRLQTGLDGTPMPSFGRNLTLDESWSLVEYVLELGEEE